MLWVGLGLFRAPGSHFWSASGLGGNDLKKCVVGNANWRRWNKCWTQELMQHESICGSLKLVFGGMTPDEQVIAPSNVISGGSITAALNIISTSNSGLLQLLSETACRHKSGTIVFPTFAPAWLFNSSQRQTSRKLQLEPATSWRGIRITHPNSRVASKYEPLYKR